MLQATEDKLEMEKKKAAELESRTAREIEEKLDQLRTNYLLLEVEVGRTQADLDFALEKETKLTQNISYLKT